MLALALGLYPGRERPQDDVEPVMHLTQPATPPQGETPAGAASSAADAPAPTTARTGAATAAPVKPVSSRDRYDALRKAWGG